MLTCTHCFLLAPGVTGNTATNMRADTDTQRFYLITALPADCPSHLAHVDEYMSHTVILNIF